MTDHAIHRNLLNAAKLLLAAFEARCRSTPHGMRAEDWIQVTRTMRAIEESKNALELGSRARKAIHEI